MTGGADQARSIRSNKLLLDIDLMEIQVLSSPSSEPLESSSDSQRPRHSVDLFAQVAGRTLDSVGPSQHCPQLFP